MTLTNIAKESIETEHLTPESLVVFLKSDVGISMFFGMCMEDVLASLMSLPSWYSVKHIFELSSIIYGEQSYVKVLEENPETLMNLFRVSDNKVSRAPLFSDINLAHIYPKSPGAEFVAKYAEDLGKSGVVAFPRIDDLMLRDGIAEMVTNIRAYSVMLGYLEKETRNGFCEAMKPFLKEFLKYVDSDLFVTYMSNDTKTNIHTSMNVLREV